MRERLNNLEKWRQDFEKEFREEIASMRVLIESKHDRVRHDMAQINTMLTGLIEEKGANTARHEANVGTLEAIRRQLDALRASQRPSNGP